MRKVLCAVATCVLAGCTTWYPATGKREGNWALGVSMVPPPGWMVLSQGTAFAFTREGFVLNKLSVVTVPLNTPLPRTTRMFTPDMSLLDMAELDKALTEADSPLNSADMTTMQAITLDGRPAYSYTYLRKRARLSPSLRVRVYGVVAGHKLYRIMYAAANQHYYEAHVKEAEKTIQSIKFE